MTDGRNNDPHGRSEKNQSKLSRRRFLKTAGLGALAAGIGTAAGGKATTEILEGLTRTMNSDQTYTNRNAVTGMATGGSDYETIKVPANTMETVKRVNPGETWENVLIDQTAPGATGRVFVQGGTIRNIGWKGKADNKQRQRGSVLHISARSDNSSALAENIYMGDGSSDRQWLQAIGNWNHTGELTVRNAHVAGWGADGMYFSLAYKSGGNGSSTVENCYAKNNNIENIRIGSTGDTIRNSVVHVEGTDAVQSNESGQKNPRGIWMRRGKNLTIENCNISVQDAGAIIASAGGEGELVDSCVSGSISGPVQGASQAKQCEPDLSPPEGVPMSAEAAASGQSGGGAAGGTGGGSTDDVFTGNRCITTEEG